MTRDPELEADFAQWNGQIARSLKALRLARGWTQLQAAERCGIDYKQFQAIEYGRARMTLYTLFRLAQGYGTSPGALLTLPVTQAPPPRQLRTLSPWRDLLATGWRVRTREPMRGQRFALYSLTAAAGAPGSELTAPDVMAWAMAPRELGKLLGDFLIQVRGSSMAPLVVDGDWCLLRRAVAAPLTGKIVLVSRGDIGGEDDARWQLKRVGAVTYDAVAEQLDVRLDSLNPAFAPQTVRVRHERELQVLGELVRVVAHASPSTD